MLTWKIFVITMSVATLTLVNVNSSGSASSSGRNRDPDTPRLRRTRRMPVINLDHIVLYNPDNARTYRWEYNTQNEFPPETFEYKCYKQIRLFCDNQYNVLQSKHCIKKAFQWYKYNLQILRDDGSIVDLEDAVYNYFASFPIYTGNFKLPNAYCDYEAGVWMANRQDFRALLQSPMTFTQLKTEYAAECEESLSDYKERIYEPLPNESYEEALFRSRINIARFALLNKSFLDIGPGSFQRNYLNTIVDDTFPARAVDGHNPYNYCQDPENNPNNQTALRLG